MPLTPEILRLQSTKYSAVRRPPETGAYLSLLDPSGGEQVTLALDESRNYLTVLAGSATKPRLLRMPCALIRSDKGIWQVVTIPPDAYTLMVTPASSAVYVLRQPAGHEAGNHPLRPEALVATVPFLLPKKQQLEIFLPDPDPGLPGWFTWQSPTDLPRQDISRVLQPAHDRQLQDGSGKFSGTKFPEGVSESVTKNWYAATALTQAARRNQNPARPPVVEVTPTAVTITVSWNHVKRVFTGEIGGKTDGKEGVRLRFLIDQKLSKQDRLTGLAVISVKSGDTVIPITSEITLKKIAGSYLPDRKMCGTGNPPAVS
jgi:hypothetical protein